MTTPNRHGLRLAAEHAYSQLVSLQSMSSVALDTWAASQTDVHLRVAAATTARLLRTEVAVWDQYDVRSAKACAKTATRLLHEPSGGSRDDRLRSLGIDPDAGPRRVTWVDAENVRANAVALAATRTRYMGRQASDYVTAHAGKPEAVVVSLAIHAVNTGSRPVLPAAQPQQTTLSITTD